MFIVNLTISTHKRVLYMDRKKRQPGNGFPHGIQTSHHERTLKPDIKLYHD